VVTAGPTAQAHGSWASPITAAKLVEGAAAPGELRVDGDDIWWSESRPAEDGRTQLVRRRADGAMHDVLPEGSNARTRVHEYGGGAWCVRDGTVWWNDWADQCVYRLDDDGASPSRVTPEPGTRHGWRHADLTVTPDGRWLVCVREEHGRAGTAEAVNELVAIPTDGSGADDPALVVTLVTGPDFVSSPRISPDGRRLAWTQWWHPQMPWDGTELWAAAFDPATAELTNRRRLAGGATESILQPEWSERDGAGAADLLALSDRSGWWNLYRFTAGERVLAEPESLTAEDGLDIGGPQWVFGERWYTPSQSRSMPDGEDGRDGRDGGDPRNGGDATNGGDGWGWDVDTVAVGTHGTDRLGVVHHGAFHPLTISATNITQLASAGEDTIAAVIADFGSEAAPATIQIATAAVRPLRPPRDLKIGPEWFSVPEHISFETSGGATAHALFYRPTNPTTTGPPGEKPPLLVLSHGGPTAAARPRLDLAKQFWTSRGFAVVDVNYRGSTGYGRPYRDALKPEWGVVDVEDCVAAARHLVEVGEVDANRLAIRGGSAGGYTTLCALAFHDLFAAGASAYGVADLGALARDTHKFESRYLDSLIGPWPEAEATYRDRSPIEHTGGFDRPLIVLQGDEDEVVPPAQARMIVDALAAKGVPHASLLFEGEQHGFRKAENIVRALEAELWFYGKVFGFEPADAIAPVPDAVGLG